MGFLNRVLETALGEENALYAVSAKSTGAFTVPREEFFHSLADQMPQKNIQAVLDVGSGSGRQMDIIVHQRDMLAKNGVYIAVDCNPAAMAYIRKYRPHLLEDRRVHLIQDFAQNAQKKVHDILDGRKLSVTEVSVPHSLISPKDIAQIWKMSTEESADDAMGLVYNACSTRKWMTRNWETVHTYREIHAHDYYLPPWFQVNRGETPKRGPRKKIFLGNGKYDRKTPTPNDLSGEYSEPCRPKFLR